MNAELLTLVAGILGFALTIGWVRSRHLSERQALGWLVSAFVLLVCGLFPRVITFAAEACHLSYPAVVLFVALGVGYSYAFGVSVALTRLNRRHVAMVQHLAILEQRVREMDSERSRLLPQDRHKGRE